MTKPRLTVIAGPNGSRKSTLIAELQRRGVEFGRYINADDIARERGLQGDEGARAAQIAADVLREAAFKEGVDFSFETVMSHISKVEFMRRAAGGGYDVVLFFVATEAPEINVDRVRNRVALGGHDVPQDRIFARYRRTIQLLPQAMLTSREATVFDNSQTGESAAGETSPKLRPVARTQLFDKGMQLSLLPPVPEWTIEALRFSSLGLQLQAVETRTRVITCGYQFRSGDEFTQNAEDANIAAIARIRAAIAEI